MRALEETVQLPDGRGVLVVVARTVGRVRGTFLACVCAPRGGQDRRKVLAVVI